MYIVRIEEKKIRAYALYWSLTHVVQKNPDLDYKSLQKTFSKEKLKFCKFGKYEIARVMPDKKDKP